jgi:carbonic anhydrase/acetyltransferase-like protein (isoleucine patch superfamily)
VNRIKYILKDLFLSNIKRIYTNLQYINNTTIIGKARLNNIKVGENCSFADNAFVVNSNISDFTSIGRNSTVINADIGKFCSISWNVTVGATQHYLNKLSTHAFYYVTNYGFAKENNKIIQKVYIEHDV